MANAVLHVERAALRANYQLLKAKANKDCGAVVKANAYGLGVGPVAQTLWEEGCRHFFVATLQEAAELRGIITDAAIYMFNGLNPGEEKDVSYYRITPVLNSMAHIRCWQDMADKHSGAALHVDTGMTRLGLSHSELATLSDNWAKEHNITLLMSHLACGSDADSDKNNEQLARFKEAQVMLPSLPTCFANSAGIFLSADFHGDIARPGCALYGINPVQGDNPMRHVATLSAPILQIRELDRDETVGYGATFAAKKGSKFAIVGIGYADGFMRLQSNKGCAYIQGHKVAIAGRVSMDMITLDVSHIADNILASATHVELINNHYTVNDMADLCDTIGYEIFTRIGNRIERTYSE